MFRLRVLLFALIAASAAPAALAVCDEGGPVGYAAMNANGQNGTTGGAGGTVVTVTTQAGLRSACDEDGPYVIQVSGSITLTSQVPVLSDKTVIGLGADAEIVGRAFLLEGAENVIIRNLTIRNSTGDGITLEDASHHVWIDHCNIQDAADGCLDISRGSDYVTVSWCKFKYTADSGHNFVSLIGSSDTLASEDAGKLHVTYHHNWWSTLCIERMPRVRFGRVHSFNNYFNAPGNNYCIRAGIESEIFSEKNYFKDVDQPTEVFVTTGTPGKIRDDGSIFDNVTGLVPATDTVFTPPYAYTPDSAADVPANVQSCAGVGVINPVAAKLGGFSIE